MPRSYRHISDYEKEILEFKAIGLTEREIGERLGLTLKQVHNFITRYNSKQRKIAAGVALKAKGRPSKDLTLANTINECQQETNKTYGYRRVWYLFDNSIVSYKTSTTQNNRLVLDTIRFAKRKEKVTTEVQLHSDQGFQYTSNEYFNLTKSYGIIPSMSRQENPYDNALAENFFSILKTECIYRIKLNTFNQAKQNIDEYIYFYNNQRLQLKTKLTPLERRNQFVA